MPGPGRAVTWGASTSVRNALTGETRAARRLERSKAARAVPLPCTGATASASNMAAINVGNCICSRVDKSRQSKFVLGPDLARGLVRGWQLRRCRFGNGP